jgi:hypothetical protein
MTYIRKPDAEPRTTVCSRRALGAVMMAALVGLSTPIQSPADPPKQAELFARKFIPLYVDTVAKADLALMLRASSFQTLVETQVNGVPGSTRPELIGGIHQGKKAMTVGLAAGQPVRFECQPGGRIIFRIGDQSIVTGLTAAQARPMASLVEEGNNGLVGLNDRVTHNGKRGYRTKVARSYIDTEEGYWLLWADAIAEDLFFRVDFANGDFPDGLTMVDSERPVTITTDGGLEILGGEPRVAFWKSVGGKRGTILRYDDLGLIMEPRAHGDFRAMETVRRVFKWTPVMRLAAESDATAFRTFVRELEQVRIATVSTPGLLIEE